MPYPKRTHCIHGHEFTPENIYPRPSQRQCRSCVLERSVRPEVKAARARRGADGRYLHHHTKVRDDKRSFVQEVVGTVCVACGDDRIAAIQYHHVDKTPERYGSKQRPLLTLGWERLKEEVMHLVALCGACHLVRHKEAV